jgi:hypothetical protein
MRQQQLTNWVALTTTSWSKCIVLILIISVWIILNNWLSSFLYASAWLYDVRVSDFHVFWLAGNAWLSGLNPYINLSAGTTPFLYPPTSLAFFALFSPFGFHLAAQLWTIVYFSIFVTAALAMTFTVQGPKRSLFVSVVVLLFFTSFPFLYLFELSQGIELIIVSLSILSFVTRRLKQGFVSAALLSVAFLMKGPAVFLLIYFVIFHRDLRYLAYFVVSSLGIIGLSLLVVPIKLYSYYVVYIVPALYSEYSLADSQSIIRLFWLTGVREPFLQAISLAGLGLFAVFVFYASSSKRLGVLREKTIRADGLFLMNGLVILLLSPRSLIYPYVWIILPSALFLSGLLIEDARAGYLAIVFFGTFLLNSSSWGFAGYLFNFAYIVTALPTALIGNLIVIISLVPIYVRPRIILAK